MLVQKDFRSKGRIGGDVAGIKRFHHRKRTLKVLILSLVGFILLIAFGVASGSGFDRDSWDPYIALGFVCLLGAGVFFLARLLVRNPAVLEVSDEGLFLPFTHRRPIRWDEVHRIRRETSPHHIVYGRRDWVVIDLLPGILAPLKLPLWRKAELWMQRQQGVRIPLHGLESDPEAVIEAIEAQWTGGIYEA